MRVLWPFIKLSKDQDETQNHLGGKYLIWLKTQRIEIIFPIGIDLLMA